MALHRRPIQHPIARGTGWRVYEARAGGIRAYTTADPARQASRLEASSPARLLAAARGLLRKADGLTLPRAAPKGRDVYKRRVGIARATRWSDAWVISIERGNSDVWASGRTWAAARKNLRGAIAKLDKFERAIARKLEG